MNDIEWKNIRLIKRELDHLATNLSGDAVSLSDLLKACSDDEARFYVWTSELVQSELETHSYASNWEWKNRLKIRMQNVLTAMTVPGRNDGNSSLAARAEHDGLHILQTGTDPHYIRQGAMCAIYGAKFQEDSGGVGGGKAGELAAQVQDMYDVLSAKTKEVPSSHMSPKFNICPCGIDRRDCTYHR